MKCIACCKDMIIYDMGSKGSVAFWKDYSPEQAEHYWGILWQMLQSQ